MLLSELTAYLEDEFSFPVDLETVIERMGDVRVEAPNTTDTETLVTILEPLGSDSFESAQELYSAVYGNVSDDYIGRKYYDDRGVPVDVNEEPLDEQNVSF